jgi:hypothetical protein
MRIHRSFDQRKTDAAVSSRGIMISWRKTLTAVVFMAGATATGLAQHHDGDDAFLPSPVIVATTVPKNGDVNPYGVAFVPENFQAGSGPLVHGDILVSNYNNSLNLQGTGTTIVRITKSGSTTTTFFKGNAPLGLSTALGALQFGFVVVGNAPTVDGTAATAGPGSLLVVNNEGKLIQTFASAEIQGPWDMALVDSGDSAIAFVSNALTGTVIRLKFSVTSSGLTLLSTRTIASGYVHRGDPVTLFVAPTGLVYDHKRNVLFVASTGDNAVFAVSNAADRESDAGLGTIVYQDSAHLHGALGLATAPNGHLLVSNNDGINPDPNQPSEIDEFTLDGTFVKQLSVDPNPGGSFGLAARSTEETAIFAAVDDNTSTLLIWRLNLE